jgi:cell division protein FtsL
MDATLSTLESEASSMNAQMTMASVMVKTTKTLTRLNKMVCCSSLSVNIYISNLIFSIQMPLQDFQKTMQMFEQNMTANNIKQEMMNDAMDAAFEGDEDEEES